MVSWKKRSAGKNVLLRGVERNGLKLEDSKKERQLSTLTWLVVGGGLSDRDP